MPRKPDSIDAEHLFQVIHSRGYQLIRERIEKAIEAKMRDVCGDLDPEQTAKVRGAIEAYRTCLDIPEILRRELKE